MRQTVFIIIALFSFTTAFSQETTPKKNILDLSNRPGDHLMMQLTSDHWTGMPDSIKSHQKGFSKGFNAYIMLDKPFKGNPKFSLGIGIGVASSNMSFQKMNIDVKSLGTKLPFSFADSTNHFKKYKLATSYLEVPLEFRYSSNPLESGKSFKVALGLKGGTMLGAHTKGKTLEDKNNNSINSYTAKESSKKFFNGTRFMGTARVGYGIFSIYGSYQLNSILKDAAGAQMRLYQIGIILSGL